MSANDRFHNAVKRGLEQSDWVVSHDPLRLEFAENERVEIDMGAEQLLAAEKLGKKLQ